MSATAASPKQKKSLGCVVWFGVGEGVYITKYLTQKKKKSENLNKKNVKFSSPTKKKKNNQELNKTKKARAHLPTSSPPLGYPRRALATRARASSAPPLARAGLLRWSRCFTMPSMAGRWTPARAWQSRPRPGLAPSAPRLRRSSTFLRRRRGAPLPSNPTAPPPSKLRGATPSHRRSEP